MMVVDIILGNLLAFFFGADVLTLLTTNDILKFSFSTVCKLFFFLLVLVTIKYFKEIDLNIPSKYWIIVNSILLLFFAIIILFIGINPLLQTKQTSIVYFFIGLCYLLVNFMVIRLFGDLCFFCKSEKILSITTVANDALQKQLSLQDAVINNVTVKRHDFKNKMLSLACLIDEGKWDDARNYISDFKNEAQISIKANFCKNSIVNALLNLKKNLSEQKKIQYNVDVDDECEFNILLLDFTSILSNLIDNAIEAASHVITKDAFVDVKIYKYKIYTAIRICNPYIIEPKFLNGDYITSKKDKSVHGLGLKSVKQTVKKYDGVLEISTNNNIFTVIVLLKY